MEIPASLLVSQLKAQRNAALDEVAMAIAQCHHLMEENAKITEIMKKQEVLLAEADNLMKIMNEARVPMLNMGKGHEKLVSGLVTTKRGRKPKSRINGFPSDAISATDASISDTTQQ